jgi:hypothetical protein
MPSSSPASTRRAVSAMSSGLGEGSPLGWLCTKMTPDAASRSSLRKTSAGSTGQLERPPTATRSSPVGRFLASSGMARNSSMRDAARRGRMEASTSALDSSWPPRVMGRLLTRRPSSTAAASRHALLGPRPRMPMSSRGPLRSRPSRPPSSCSRRAASRATGSLALPVPSRIASRSSAERLSAPCSTRRSRGPWRGGADAGVSSRVGRAGQGGRLSPEVMSSMGRLPCRRCACTHPASLP